MHNMHNDSNLGERLVAALLQSRHNPDPTPNGDPSFEIVDDSLWDEMPITNMAPETKESKENAEIIFILSAENSLSSSDTEDDSDVESTSKALNIKIR